MFSNIKAQAWWMVADRFRNTFNAVKRGMKFTDVTEEARVAGEGYAMGVAAADYDNDGDVDLFVAGLNRNILYQNDGQGRFDDVTKKGGLESKVWSVT